VVKRPAARREAAGLVGEVHGADITWDIVHEEWYTFESSGES
jgi:hypothetical protein